MCPFNGHNGYVQYTDWTHSQDKCPLDVQCVQWTIPQSMDIFNECIQCVHSAEHNGCPLMDITDKTELLKYGHCVRPTVQCTCSIEELTHYVHCVHWTQLTNLYHFCICTFIRKSSDWIHNYCR